MVLSTHRKGKEAGMFYQQTMAAAMADAHSKTKKKQRLQQKLNERITEKCKENYEYFRGREN